MAKRCYYKVLQVSRRADAAALKKAYRRLAWRYHPDQNQSDPTAETKFREVAEAYRVLADPATRRRYDMLGHRGVTGVAASVADDPMEELFAELGRVAGRVARGVRRRLLSRPGRDLQTTVTVSVFEAASGCDKILTLPRRPGGEGTPIKERAVSVRIPPGRHAGTVLRWPGEGAPGIAGGPNGALIVRVSIAPHPYFSITEHDVRASLPLSAEFAASGGRLEVPTVRGVRVIGIPAGVCSGESLRIRGAGIPGAGQAEGHAIFVVSVCPAESEGMGIRLASWQSHQTRFQAALDASRAWASRANATR